MLRLVAACAAALVALTEATTCPSYVRAVNSYMPTSSGVAPLDLYINGKKVFSSLSFRKVTDYFQVPSGPAVIGVKSVGAADSAAFLASANFTVAAGKFYTAGFLGMVAPPIGTLVYARAPVLVNEDVRRVPNPDRFTGLWYRWSETNLVIDFRTVNGDPDPATAVATAADAERITLLAAKTVIPIAELPAGQAYSFYPTVVGSNAPLQSARLTSSGGVVAVRNLQTQAGKVYDFFATGDSLLNTHNFNLEVQYIVTPLSFDTFTGCTIVPGNADYAAAEAGAPGSTAYISDTVDEINAITAATLAFVLATLALGIISIAVTCYNARRRAELPLKSVPPTAGAAAARV